MTNHKQVRLTATNADDGTVWASAAVDELMAPLISALWRRGIPTVGSCQDGSAGWAWVSFESTEDGDAFRAEVAEIVGSENVSALEIQAEDRDPANPFDRAACGYAFLARLIPKIAVAIERQ